MEENKKINDAVEDAYSKAMDDVIAEKAASDAEANKPWYEKNRKAVTITIIVLVVLIIGCVAGLILYNNHYQSMTRGILLYQNDGTMMSCKAFKDAAYSHQWNTWNFNEKNADNNSNPAAVTTDGKYLYFAENVNGSVFDLYYAKKGSNKPLLISEKVTDYEVSEKGVVYYAADNGFYRYIVKDGEIQNLCSNAEKFSFNEKKNTAIVLGGSGKELFMIGLDEEATVTSLDSGIDAIVEVSKDLKYVVYEKENSLYYMTTKDGNSVKIAKDYTEYYIYNIDKKCEVYYLNDDNELNYFKAGDDDSQELLEDVCGIYGQDDEVAMLFVATGSDLSDCEYVLVTDGEAIAMKDMDSVIVGEEVYFDTSDKRAYFIGYEKQGDTIGTLYSMGYQMLNKGKVEVVENNVVSIEYADKKMYLGKDSGNGNVDLYYDSVLVARDIIPNSTSVTADGRAVVFAYRISDALGNRKLALYDGESVAEIGSCAREDYCAVSEKEIYFLQFGEQGYNLVKYNGNKIKVQAEGVEDYKYLFY